MKYLFKNLLLDPNQDGGGDQDPPSNENDGDEGAPDVEALKQTLEAQAESIRKLEEVAKKERELKRDAELAAKKAKEDAENASKTAEQRLEERIQAVETENRSLKLQTLKETAIKTKLAALEAEGLEVDRSALDNVLAVTSLSIESVDSVVGVIADSLKRPKSTKIETKNTQPPLHKGKPKYQFGQLTDDAFSQPE